MNSDETYKALPDPVELHDKYMYAQLQEMRAIRVALEALVALKTPKVEEKPVKTVKESA